MTAPDNTQIVQQAIASFLRGDMPALLATMTDDIHWTLPEIEGVSFSGARNGRDAVGQFFTDLLQQQTPVKFEPREYIAQNDQVVVLGHYVWTVKENGRTWESNYAHVFTVRNGRVSGFQEFMDTSAARAAFMGTSAGVKAGADMGLGTSAKRNVLS